MELVDEGMCFICGKANPIGLQVDFDVDRKGLRIKGKFTPRREHEGYKGIMHGGLVAALLDEAMVKLLWEVGIPAVSAALDIRLARPAKVGEPISISGWVDSLKGRLILAAARAEDAEGNLVAEAKSRCIRVSGAAPNVQTGEEGKEGTSG
jgi:acyl-coenzyme A thioesterase PaaI-like protein